MFHATEKPREIPQGLLAIGESCMYICDTGICYSRDQSLSFFANPFFKSSRMQFRTSH